MQVLFLNDVFRFAERDAHFVCDVSFGRDVRFACEKERILSFLPQAQHHLPLGQTSLFVTFLHEYPAPRRLHMQAPVCFLKSPFSPLTFLANYGKIKTSKI